MRKKRNKNLLPKNKKWKKRLFNPVNKQKMKEMNFINKKNSVKHFNHMKKLFN